MRLLFDQNISFRIVNILIDIFPESKHVCNIGLSDTEDIDICQFARKENYVIVTFDSDYYDISLINGCPPKVIWLRTGNVTTEDIKNLVVSNSQVITDFINNEDNSDKACLEIDEY
jgi:predicted nuclease of predicted toxin-antitoxin system